MFIIIGCFVKYIGFSKNCFRFLHSLTPVTPNDCVKVDETGFRKFPTLKLNFDGSLHCNNYDIKKMRDYCGTRYSCLLDFIGYHSNNITC